MDFSCTYCVFPHVIIPTPADSFPQSLSEPVTTPFASSVLHCTQLSCPWQPGPIHVQDPTSSFKTFIQERDFQKHIQVNNLSLFVCLFAGVLIYIGETRESLLDAETAKTSILVFFPFLLINYETLSVLVADESDTKKSCNMCRRRWTERHTEHASSARNTLSMHQHANINAKHIVKLCPMYYIGWHECLEHFLLPNSQHKYCL